jgi:hypothetical protein
MRKFLLAVLLSLFAVVGASGQSYTTVTATVVDNSTASTPYALGTYNVSLVNNTGQQATFGGSANFQQSYTGQSLSSTGFLSIVLPSVTAMSPGGLQWAFNICANPQQIAAVFPPVALPCFTYTSTGTLISGSSVNLSAQMKAVATTIPLPSGSGGGITSVVTLPGTCTAGQQFLLPTGVVITCGPAANQFFASGPEGATVSPLSYGYTPDVMVALGKTSTIAINSGNATITVTPGPFTLANVNNKEVFATAGCCINTLYGTAQVLNAATATYVSATTITVSPAPIATCTTTCILAWGTVATVNDTALAAAEAAWAASSTPANFHFPAGWAFVRKGHFHAGGLNWGQGANFTNIGTGLIEYGGGSITGEGNSVSQLIPDPSFDFTTGSGNSCGSGTNLTSCFGYAGGFDGPFLREWGIDGLHQSLTGGNHTVNLVEWPGNTKLLNMEFTIWGDADTSAVGMALNSGNMTSSNADNFGGGGGTMKITGGNVYLAQNFIGESNGTSLSIQTGPVYSYSNYIGQVNGASPIVTQAGTGIASAWYSTDDFIYVNISANNNIFCQASTFCYFDRLWNVNTGTGTFNALYCPGSCFIRDSDIQGGTTGSALVTNGGAGGGTIFNEGNNVLGTISSTVTPTIASSAGTSAATVDTFSFNESGSFTLTGNATAAATTVTLTFAGTFALNAQPPRCSLTLRNGTGTWNARASIIEGTPTTTTYIWNLDNNAVNLAASTYKGAWTCRNSA